MSKQNYVTGTDIPEGATHYMPESGYSCFSWVCFKDKDKPAQMYIICPENNILSWVKFTPYEDEYEELELYKIPDVHYVNIKLKVG